MSVAVLLLEQVDEACEAGVGRHELARAAFEERAPLARDRLGIFEVLLEESARVARVQSVDVVHGHRLCCTNRDPSRRALSRP